MSPTRSPGQPSRPRASLANFSRKSKSSGVPQLRLRGCRITCQSGPLIGSDTPPARQPLAYEPIARAASGAGAATAPNRSRAIGDLGALFLEVLGAGFATGLGGTAVAAVLFGVACSAATTPQNNRGMRLKTSLRICPRLWEPPLRSLNAQDPSTNDGGN